MSEPRRLGRPPKSESEKRQQIGVRTSPELKELLEGAASANGRSVAQEAELRLLESFRHQDQRTQAVMGHLAALATSIQLRMGNAWYDDYAAWVAFDESVRHVLASHSPPIPNSRALKAALDREKAAKENLEEMTNFFQKIPLQAESLAATDALGIAAIPAIDARKTGKRVATELIDLEGNSMSQRFQRITRSAIRALAVGERLIEHGITVERMLDGDARYSVNIMVDGQRIHRVIGRESEGVTREQAERAIESFRTKAREGRLDLPKGRKNHRLFTEATAEYLTRLEETNGKDMANKKRHLEQQLIPYFGKYRADKITTFNVQHYCRKRLNEGAKQATVNRELSTLSHFMNRLADWKWIKADDKPKIEKGDEPRKPIVVMTEAHTSALMNAAIADQDGRLFLFVAFGLNAAMRHSEIVAVRYDQIDFDARRIHIPKAKAGMREQPITPALADMLSKQREMEIDRNGWVFPAIRRSKLPHRRDMDVQFQRAVIRAGLNPQKVTPHVMRHTAITRLVKAGVDIPTIQKISGHKTLMMVLRYVHIHGTHIDDAIAAIDTGNLAAFTPKLHTAKNSAERRAG